MEDYLAQRAPDAVAIPPAIAHALESFSSSSDIRAVVAGSGYSHRRFIELFRRVVGLSPKEYARVLRFQGAIRLLADNSSSRLASIALHAGYTDQPHFSREFRRFSDMTPQQFRKTKRFSPYCVAARMPYGKRVNSVQDGQMATADDGG